MGMRATVRVVLGILWGLLFAFYVAAKLDFFTNYDPAGVGSYLSRHSQYWAAMAAAAFLIWLLTRWFPQDRR